jgi:GT2 family glycosyltransferase
MKKGKSWILINFYNVDNIHKIIKSYGDVFTFIVVDNSGNYINYYNELVISPGENLGYLGGLKFAISSIKNHSNFMFIFSNSDINVITEFNEILENMSVRSVVVPRIISPRGEQNPHITFRRKRGFWFIRFLFSSNNFTWFIWNSIGLKKNKLLFKSVDISSIRQIYAGHGSFYIFNKINFSKFIKTRHNFLYGEEVHLAEFFLKNKIPVFFNPNLVISHDEHTSTSMLDSNIRRRFYNESYKTILTKYYKRSSDFI